MCHTQGHKSDGRVACNSCALPARGRQRPYHCTRKHTRTSAAVAPQPRQLTLNTRSSGRSSGSRQMTHPTPAYWGSSAWSKPRGLAEGHTVSGTVQHARELERDGWPHPSWWLSPSQHATASGSPSFAVGCVHTTLALHWHDIRSVSTHHETVFVPGHVYAFDVGQAEVPPAR